MQSNEAGIYAPDEILDITRVFDAPPPLLFRIWAEPQHRLRWWGPEGYALSHCEVDFREGGDWSIAMRRVDGYEHWVHGQFTEIREPSRLCFTYINDDDEHETLVTMDFVARGNQTEMRFRQAPFATIEARDGHSWGWNSSLDLLAGYLHRVSRIDLRPVGRPRLDGVAEDIIAARERHELEKRQAKTHSPSDDDNQG